MSLALAGAAGWGVGTLLVKLMVERKPGLDLLSMLVGQYAVSAPVLVLLAFALERRADVEWGAVELWGAVVWLAVGSMILARLAFYAALKRVTAARASAWILLIPVLAVLIEIARGSSPSTAVLLGMGVTIAGVALADAAAHQARRALGIAFESQEGAVRAR
jgi:drug/metabolite transporter (DMT)-like permease